MNASFLVESRLYLRILLADQALWLSVGIGATNIGVYHTQPFCLVMDRKPVDIIEKILCLPASKVVNDEPRNKG